MKPVLLALAVMLVCVVYEIDRGSRLWAEGHPQIEVDRVLNARPDGRELWLPRNEEGSAGLRPPPFEAQVPRHATGSVEREKSIRLFGPGVSRRQQIRV